MASCDPSCWLRTYRASTVTETPDFNAQAYTPEASPIYGKINPWDIRILCIKPGSAGSELITTLHVGQLDQKTLIIPELGKNIPFEALSYSWGYGGDTIYISCNGVKMKILKNLYDAFVALRRADRERYIWCDVFCINQTDPADKNEQIQKMFQIYYKAENTIAWLGHTSQAGDRALEFLSTFSEHIQHGCECTEGLQDIYSGIVTLCSRPWFSRTWVRQEVFAARSIYVQVDNVTLPFEDLKERAPKALKAIQGHLVRVGATGGLNDINQELSHLAPHRRPNPRDTALLSTVPEKRTIADMVSLSLDLVLRGSSNFDATNKSDFIYGIISMTTANTATAQDVANRHSPAGTAPLIIDYSRPEAQVFADTTVYLINLHQSLDLIFLSCFESISGSQAATSSPRPPGLPTWSPSWKSLPRHVGLDPIWSFFDAWKGGRLNNPPAANRVPILCYEQTSSIFGKRKADLYRSPPIQPLEHSGRLRVRGTFLGSLKSRSKFNMKNSLGLHRPDAVRSFALEVAEVPGFKEVGFEPSDVPRNQNVPLPPKVMKKPSMFSTTQWELETKHRSVSFLRESLAAGPCWAPPAARNGDLVAMLDGACLPAIVRLVSGSGASDPEYELVGPMSSVELLRHERNRAHDRGYEMQRRKEDKEKYVPWPYLGPLQEDLDVSEFILV